MSFDADTPQINIYANVFFTRYLIQPPTSFLNISAGARDKSNTQPGGIDALLSNASEDALGGTTIEKEKYVTKKQVVYVTEVHGLPINSGTPFEGLVQTLKQVKDLSTFRGVSDVNKEYAAVCAYLNEYGVAPPSISGIEWIKNGSFELRFCALDAFLNYVGPVTEFKLDCGTRGSKRAVYDNGPLIRELTLDEKSRITKETGLVFQITPPIKHEEIEPEVSSELK